MGQWAHSRPGKICQCCVMAYKIQNCLNVHFTSQLTGCMVVMVQYNANRLLSVSFPISKNRADLYMLCKAMAQVHEQIHNLLRKLIWVQVELSKSVMCATITTLVYLMQTSKYRYTPARLLKVLLG